MAWAVITMLHGAATNWQMLAGLRGLMGFAEGSAQPGGMKAVAEWFPAKERGFAGGFYNIGASFGSMLAAPAGCAIHPDPQLASRVRDRGCLRAGVGGDVVPLLLLAEAAPEALRRRTRAHRTGQEAHLAAGDAKTSILSLLKQRNIWGIAIPRMLADPTWGTLAIWVPFYLTTERGFDLKQIALFAWLPFVTADIGCLAGPTIVRGCSGAVSVSSMRDDGLSPWVRCS